MLRKLEWIFDYYFAWMFYNGMKQDRYVQYMRNKWSEKIKAIQENWIGKKVGGSVAFYHSGPYSIFLDANIDIALPSEMTNQIISRRL